MIGRILVPLDGTDFSEHSLPWAVSLARRSGATLGLATVEVPPPVAFPDFDFLQPLTEAELAYLETVGERLRDAGVENVTMTVLNGDAAEALEKYRRSMGADLTVMATHGRGGVARSWLGSVADQFARSTAAPVLMVRPRDQDGPVDLDALPQFRRVLVTLDGSALSESVLEPALHLAGLYGAEIVLARLVEYPRRTESVYLPDAVEIIEEQLEESRVATHDELSRIADRLRTDGGPQAKTVTRVVNHAAEGILEVADEEEVDLIAMASHGRGGVRRVVLGSVTDKVLRASDRPVLVVRSER